MTYRQHAEWLLEEIGKWLLAMEYDNNGIPDKTTIAYKKWQDAQGELNALTSLSIKNKLNWDDHFTTHEEINKSNE